VHRWLLSGALDFAVSAILIFICAIHFAVCWRKSVSFGNQQALNLTASLSQMSQSKDERANCTGH
jgi:hypothetical protein